MTRPPWPLARRSFLLGAGLTALAACSSPAGVSCPTSAHVVTGARPGPGSTARSVVPRLRPRLAVNRLGWRSADRPW